MPWTTPTLTQVRQMARDFVTGQLASGPMIPNSVLRVMSDSNAGLAYLVLLYLNYISQQLLPDTAEADWLDRFAAIWLPNNGRKQATYASGQASVSGILNTILPAGTQLNANSLSGVIAFQTSAQVEIGAGPTSVNIQALTAGASGNLAAGTTLSLAPAVSGVNGQATVVSLSGGLDEETDDELRTRILTRIQQPPMGGDAEDYVQWALEVSGVTRAWASPQEMGVGTMTVRFMMDDLRATDDPMTNGFPLPADCATVLAYLNTKRPVTVKDIFVCAPVPEPIDFTVSNLDSDDASTWAAIATSVTAMLAKKAAPATAVNGVAQPAQEIYAAWVSDAILQAAGVTSFDLAMNDHPMPTPGSMAVLGQILRG